MLNEDNLMNEEVDNLYCQAASADPDTMYLHEARKEKDWPQFKQAMQSEIDGKINNKNFRVIPRKSLPENTKVLPGVWVLRRKRKILTGKVYKYKARLNLDGSKQEKGIHFDQTYAPVASWAVVRLILILALVWGWKARQLDYVMAFTQAPTERPMYMEVPKGYTITNGNPKDFVLEILANTYGARQAPRVWYKYLIGKLKKAKWKQSRWFPTIFLKTV